MPKYRYESDIPAFVKNCERDPYRKAFIATEDDETFVHDHGDEIGFDYCVRTGCYHILIKQSYSGVCFHTAPISELDFILKYGLKLADSKKYPFGGNAIYGYPTPKEASKKRGPIAIFKIEHGPGTLRCPDTDKIVCPPETITGITLFQRNDDCTEHVGLVLPPTHLYPAND